MTDSASLIAEARAQCARGLRTDSWNDVIAAFDRLAAALEAATQWTDDQRDEVARVLQIVAEDGLPGPRDLDVALDAIQAALLPLPTPPQETT